LKFDFRDTTPVDPQAEEKRAQAMKLVGAIIEERARLGLPPIFATNVKPRGPAPPMIEGALSSKPGPANAASEAPTRSGDATPKKPNGHGGNGHG
jgi:hypothetical protein